MDLLSGYVDSDEEQEEQTKAQGGEPVVDAGIVIPGFESYKPDTAPASHASSPAVSASGLPERLRSAAAHGAAPPGDSDSTPGAARPRHHRFKVVSKSSTPVIHGSPSMHQSMPSDESTPNSPSRQSALAAAAAPPEVVLPEKPDGEVEKALAGRVERYMSMRCKPQPVFVNQDLYDKKEFHNPGILEMLMSQYNILEKGSNYPTELFNPEYDEILYYDKIRSVSAGRRPTEAQQTVSQHLKNASLVQHISVGPVPTQTTAGAALAGAAAAAAAIAGRLSGEGAMRRSNSSASMDSVARKKSKWDSASLLGGAPSISMASTGIAAQDFERIRQLTTKK